MSKNECMWKKRVQLQEETGSGSFCKVMRFWTRLCCSDGLLRPSRCCVSSFVWKQDRNSCNMYVFLHLLHACVLARVCVCVCTQVADTQAELFQIIYSTVGHRRHLHDAAKEVPQCLWLPPQLWPPPPLRAWHTCLFTCTRGITVVCMWLYSRLIQSIRSCYAAVSAVIAMLLSMIPASNLASLLRMST